MVEIDLEELLAELENDSLNEGEEDEEEPATITEEELRTAVKEGQIAGFIGTMKDFK